MKVDQKKLIEVEKKLVEAQEIANEAIKLEDTELRTQLDIYAMIEDAIYALEDLKKLKG